MACGHCGRAFRPLPSAARDHNTDSGQTITQGSCAPKTVNAGETYIEIPDVPVRAVATGSIVWTATLLGRYEDKLLTPVASPC